MLFWRCYGPAHLQLFTVFPTVIVSVVQFSNALRCGLKGEHQWRNRSEHILMDAAPFLPEYGSPKLVEVGQTIGRHEAKEDACGTLIPKVLAEDVIVPT